MSPPCPNNGARLAGDCPVCEDGPCVVKPTVAQFAARNDIKRRDCAGLARFLGVEQKKRA